MEVAFSNGMTPVVVTMKSAKTEPQSTYEYNFVKVSQLQITLVHCYQVTDLRLFQTDAVSADRRDIITPTVRYYLAHPE